MAAGKLNTPQALRAALIFEAHYIKEVRLMQIVTLIVMLLLLLATASYGEAVFEDVHVVPMPLAEWGYRGMNGDILELKDGALVYCYTRNGIVARTSEDKGRTWSEEFVLVPNPGPPSTQGYYCHPSFLRLPNGEILLSYIYVAATTPYFENNYYKRSNDEGQTWSEQFVVTPYPGCTEVHNDKLRLLSTGRILAPAAHKKHRPGEADHSDYVSLMFYSDTNGYSWLVANNDIDMLPVEAQEPHVVELKDGRVMLICRNYSGYVGRAYSEDQGETWSDGELCKDLPLPPNTSAVTVDRIPSTGDLLLIRCSGGDGTDYGRRTPFVATISKDEGQTWINERVIAGDLDDDYGYQSVTFVDDVALISYHKRDGLWVARIGLDWFYQQDGD